MTHTALKMPRSAIRALNDAACEYPGGIAALAKIVGRSVGVLNNKFSEADERFDLMCREGDALALEVRRVTGNQDYIEAKCAIHGGLFVQLPEAGIAADDDVLTSLLETLRGFGDLARELTEARADGLITNDEAAAYELRAKRLIARLHESVQTVKAQVQDLAQVPAALKVVGEA